MREKTFKTRILAVMFLLTRGYSADEYDDFLNPGGAGTLKIFLDDDGYPMTYDEAVKEMARTNRYPLSVRKNAHIPPVRNTTPEPLPKRLASGRVKKSPPKPPLVDPAPKAKMFDLEGDEPPPPGAKISTGNRYCSAVCRDMIKKGYTNLEIWEVIKVEFNLTKKHRRYPAWFRADMNRRNL